MKKIDVHCHTTNRKLSTAAEDASIASIQQEMKKHSIEETVVLATYFPHNSSGISNYRLLHWIRDYPSIRMFGSMDFDNYYFQGLNELAELAENKLIKGIKVYTCYQDIDLQSERFDGLLKIAERYSLPMMFHAGYSYSSLRKYGTPSIKQMVSPVDIAYVAAKSPGSRIIISHMAKPFQKELISLVKVMPNIYSDMSGLIDSRFDRAEIPSAIANIEQFVGECGPERLLFGTDFPVQTHEDSILFIEEGMKGYSDPDKSKVYYENARRILNE